MYCSMIQDANRFDLVQLVDDHLWQHQCVSYEADCGYVLLIVVCKVFDGHR